MLLLEDEVTDDQRRMIFYVHRKQVTYTEKIVQASVDLRLATAVADAMVQPMIIAATTGIEMARAHAIRRSAIDRANAEYHAKRAEAKRIYDTWFC